jgi:hypothetical protein
MLPALKQLVDSQYFACGESHKRAGRKLCGEQTYLGFGAPLTSLD